MPFEHFKHLSEHYFICNLRHAREEEEKMDGKTEQENEISDKKESEKCMCKNCFHGRILNGYKKGIHSCDFCDKTFSRTDKLRAHISTHTGLFLFKCKHCNKDFSRSDKMKRHVAEKHSLKTKLYMCKKCVVSFTRSSTLKNHKCRTGSESFTNNVPRLIV
jgi:hypothetical protein